MEPIALIPELTKSLTKVGRGLAPWDRLVRLEEQLLRRARSAFLVHWFGTGVPVKRLNLYIVIANVADLRDRFRRVQDSRPDPLPEMNLLGPLAGISGVLVGLFMSPMGSILVAPYLHEILGSISGSGWMDAFTLLYTVVLNWMMPLMGPGLVVFVGLPLALVAAVGMARQRSTRVVVELLGHLAMMIDAGLALWEQINGPRTEVRNPLLRRLLDFLDAFANLFAQILGAVALIVVRVLPLVPNLLNQFSAFATLAQSLLDALMAGLAGFLDALKAPFERNGGIGQVLSIVFDTLMTIPERILEHLGNYLSDAATDMGNLFDSVSSQIGTYLSGVRDKIAEAFAKTHFGQLLDLIGGLMRIIPGIAAAIWSALNTPGPPEPPEEEGDLATELREGAASYASDTPEAVADVLDALGNLALPELPDFSLPPIPEVPGMPDTAALQAEIGRSGPVDYALEAERLFRAARENTELVVQPEEILQRPGSFFGPEQRALAGQGQPTITEQDQRLRDALFLAVGRVLPGNLRLFAPRLQSYFDMLDETIYDRETPQNRPPPQQELEDYGRLQPRINTLRIRATGAQAPDLRAFRDRLVDRLQFEDYRAPQGAGSGG